jgi:hypothetical protein
VQNSRTQIVGEDEDAGYGVEEDFAALVEQIDGAGISAMRQRAKLYAGSVEATRVPGVGFTLSVIFPSLRVVGGETAQGAL